MEERKVYLTRKDLEIRYQVTGKTIYSWIKTKDFPSPTKFGSASRWSLDQVISWEEKQPQGVAA